MRVKVSSATPQQLDWMVTYVLYGEQAHYIYKHSKVRNQYASNWAHAGPIIEGERLCIDIGHDGVWLACNKQNYDDVPEFMHAGSTTLIAAMRCFVAFRLGDEVELPEELI